jgi:CheY-like chemotaxis protein
LLEKTLTPNIELATDLCKDPWLTLIDPGDLEDSILNLAINARDAMPDGGKLLIQSRNIVLNNIDMINFEDINAGDYVQINVSDTGTGMSSDVVEHVFEPFFTTKDPDKGTGLGLSRVYGFAKRCGGQVKIYSEVGFGTTISLYIKRAEAMEEQAVESVIEESELQKGTETILMAEDEQSLAGVYKTGLEALGYSVLVANNGPSALELLSQQNSVDLLLTDVVMPGGISGLELAKITHERYPDIKVIVTSGIMQSLNDDPEYGEVLQYNIQKPYRLRDLVKLIRTALDN